MGKAPRSQLFCSWFIFRGVSCHTVLTSGFLVFWFSGLLACVLNTDFSLSGDCPRLSCAVLYLPPLLLSHYCWAALRFIAISTLIGSYGVFAWSVAAQALVAVISWFWLAASFVNRIICLRGLWSPAFVLASFYLIWVSPSRSVIFIILVDIIRLETLLRASFVVRVVWKSKALFQT
jgi:hypothetical protein